MSITKNILKESIEEKQLQKASKQLYYTTQSLLGIHGVYWYWLCGSRGRGKSFAVVETYLQYCRKYGYENCQCYYFRISDLSIRKILENKGAKAIDKLLIRRYNLDITTKNNTLYNHGKPLMYFYPLVSAAKAGKGIAEYDPDFLRPGGPRRYIFVILDEFQADENLERKGIGDPVSQFKVYIENILRDQEQLDYNPVKIFGCANNVSECSDFLAQICGFIPEKLGRFVLKRKHMVVENIPNSAAYLEKRKKSITADIMDYEEDTNYTNVVKRDKETLKPKKQRLRKVDAVIQFSKDPKFWFTVWDGNIIKKYNGQSYRRDQVLAMKRHIDTRYSIDVVNDIIARYDARAFMYADLISQASFRAQIKLIKK